MKIDLEAENKYILSQYKELILSCKGRLKNNDQDMIRTAFEFAVKAHKDIRRKSGEPYIYHPIAVAKICSQEIGLGTTAIISALLHDTVEDTDVTIEDIHGLFGEKVATIVNGLTKIQEFTEYTNSEQAENFKKMLLTLSDDVRVILVKLADRLHNMRTLEHMSRKSQLKTASETKFMYAPLAHRLGLNNIKTELEDLSLKHTDSEGYYNVIDKLKETENSRKTFIQNFIEPIEAILKEQGFKVKMFGRPKSIYSIYNKIKNKGVAFEEIYDLFAIRIIIDSNLEQEKADCWRIYSIINEFYYSNPDRLRDWISNPKSNGYESLHTTVMGPEGKWVEVQIRSIRMDELAEQGFAAHWKYKDSIIEKQNNFEIWLNNVRDILNNKETSALELIDDFKLNFFAEDIYVFTPKGEMKSMPSNATVLDFAYDIHSKIGDQCIGAKINYKLVPINHKLSSGDQIEILTSSKQTPKDEWLSFVNTARAKAKIKNSLKELFKQATELGKITLEKKFQKLKFKYTKKSIDLFAEFQNLPSNNELYYRIHLGNIDDSNIESFVEAYNQGLTSKPKTKKENKVEEFLTSFKRNAENLVLGDAVQTIKYNFSPCCKPIPGDDVIGFIEENTDIKIHRISCKKATELLSNFSSRVVKAKWNNEHLISFLAGLKLVGTDEIGLVNNITKVISSQLNINMRSIKFDTENSIFEGTIMVYVHDTKHLNHLIQKLQKVKGVTHVTRLENE